MAKNNSRQTRKRKATSTNNTSNMFSSGGRKSKKKNSNSIAGGSGGGDFNEDTAEEIFVEELADNDDTHVAGMEGISKLCEKLQIDPLEDIRVLVLLWKLGANDKPGQINKDEWMAGCSKYNLDSITKFQGFLPGLDTGFLDRTAFKDFYKFCFQFNRQGTHRTLDKDMIVALLQMVLKGRIPDDRLDTFCAFVESQTSYTRITLDQWTSFLDFCYDVEDLSMYDESTSAWPVLIDEYVEYMEKQQQKK